MDQSAGPNSGRIQPPKDYRAILKAKGVTLPLVDNDTRAYELDLGAAGGIIYCREGAENLLEVVLAIRDHGTDVERADLNKILDLYTPVAPNPSKNRRVFQKIELTSAAEYPDRWISIRQILQRIPVDVDNLLSKPTLVKVISELAAIDPVDGPDWSALKPPREVLENEGPYGLGS